MAAEIVERWDSRSGQRDATGAGSSTTLTYVVVGSNDDAEVHELAKSTLPAYYQYLPFRHYRLEFKGGDLWYIEAEYGYGGGQTKVTVSTTGGTRHVTQSIETRKRYALGEGAGLLDIPNFKGAIGVNGDTVEGADVGESQLSFTVEKWMPYLTVKSPEYLLTLATLTYCTNDAPFLGFQAGEVLFLGVEGAYDSLDLPEIDPDLRVPYTYKFSASPNREDIVLDDIMVLEDIGTVDGISRKGHEYLWVRYKEEVDGTYLTKRPLFVYVERVYREGDLSLLGIA